MDDMDDFGDLYGDLVFHTRDYSEKKEGDGIEANPIKFDSVVKEAANFEGEGNNNNNYNIDSDDDDDFRIVLNENEYQKFEKSKVGVGGFDEEGEFDDFDNCLNNEQLSPNEADEFVQASEVRGHRFSRHTRSHLERFRRSVGGSVLGSGAWDNPMMPCYNRDISAAAQAGSTFCLPRNRTIFDINIEAFEQKPWRLKGADMTDYFNFDLDEESWKSYWESLNHLKNLPVYQSSRLNQGERKFSFPETLEKEPKGRAIEVEGSLGERIPSTDIRRPRARDPNVVIQINMEDSVEDESGLYKDSLEHIEEHADSSLSTSRNNSSEGIMSPRHDGQISRDITTSVDHYSPESNGGDIKVTSGKVKNKVDCKKDGGSDSGNQVAHLSGSYNLQSHSEKSDDAVSMGKDRKTPVKKSQVSIESDHYLSYDSISNATESQQEECKNVVHEPDTSSGEHKYVSSRRLKSVAELNVSKDDELTSRLNHWHHQNDLDLLDTWCKTRKRKSNYNTKAGGHIYSYRETEMALNFKGRTHAANHGSTKSCTEDLQRGDRVTHRAGNWDDEDSLKQRECYFSERQYENRGRKSSLRKCSRQPISKTKFFGERDSYLRLAKDSEDEHWIRMEPECDGIMRDHRPSEWGIQEMCGKHKHNCDVKEEIYDFKFHRHFYPTDKDITSPKRSRYDRRLNIVKGASKFVDDGAAAAAAYHRLVSHRYEEPSNIDETEWNNDFSSREHLHTSWRSKGRFVNHGDHPNTRDLQFKNKRIGCFVPSIKDRHCLLYEDSLEYDIDGYISEGNIYCENVISSIQMRRCNRPSNPNIHIDAGARFRHYEHSNLPCSRRYLLERSTKYDKFHISKPSFIRQRLLGRRQLNNAGKIRGVGMSGSDTRGHGNFAPGMGKHELAAVSREAINKHLNGFKGKQLARRYSRVLGESNKEIGTGYKLDNQLKNFKHPQKASKQEEIHNGECSHSYQTGLKMDNIKDPKSFNKLPVLQNVEDNEIEEGELIEGFDKQDTVSGKRGWNSGKKTENFQSKDSLRSVKIAGIYDNSHILRTIAKMEKRKERFKEPIAPRKEPEKVVNPQLDVSNVTDGVKEQRPARKRRWGGN